MFKSSPSWKFKEFVKIKKRETNKKNWIKNNSNEKEKYIITEVKIWINILHKKFKPIKSSKKYINENNIKLIEQNNFKSNSNKKYIKGITKKKPTPVGVFFEIIFQILIYIKLKK